MAQEKFSVASVNVDSRIKNTKRILANMNTFISGTGKSSVLLDGDPGVGKTSYVRFLGKLLGMKVVTIEAPHITEEHIINIPFIVFNPKTNQAETKNTSEKVETGKDQKEFDIILADSNLYNEIKHIKELSDADYLKAIYTGPGSSADLIKTFEAFGGNENTIPPKFKAYRDKFKVILFLDEFFRQTSPRIRNMLRGILNGKIGFHDIPVHVYVMYASNLRDQGVEGIPLNYQFQNINFSAPSKDEWFSWFYAKYNKPDSGVKLNTAILEKFHKALDSEHLSHDDIDAEVRISPRRWEQLLLYINSSLPVSNAKDAMSLMTNIHHNFQNYKTGEKAALLDKVSKAVVELIKETSDVSISENQTNEDSDWRTTLQHQIEQKIKLGDHRTYIPVISGAPGIGKTSEVVQMANDMDMGLVYIDTSTLDPEDVHGIPLAEEDKEKNVSVKFSMPKLYKMIEDKIKDLDGKMDEHIKKKYKDDKEKIKALKDRKYKFIIFFDELNRTSTKVFNGIRRVLLEKNFGDNMKVDPRSIMIAAINPEDNGASDLSDHLKDVVDIIHSAPNWSSTKKYMEAMNVTVDHDISKDISINSIEVFSEKFKSKDKTHSKSKSNFYLDVGSSDIYISPREYTDMYANMAFALDMEVDEIFQEYTEFTKDNTPIIEKKIRQSISESFDASLSNIFFKQDVESPEFFSSLNKWIMKTSDLTAIAGMFSQKTETASLDEILQHIFTTGGDLSKEAEFNNYLGNVEPVKFKEDIFGFFREELKTDVDLLQKLGEKNRDKKSLDEAGVLKVEKEKVSQVEHMIREVIHALHHNKMSNDFIEQVRNGIRELLSDLNNKYKSDEHEEVIMDFMFGISKYVKTIK